MKNYIHECNSKKYVRPQKQPSKQGNFLNYTLHLSLEHTETH